MSISESRRRPPGFLPYRLRRPYTVADSLDNMRGPTSGVVELPHHMDWSGSPAYDLDEPRRLESMYKTVLNEAATADDLNRWLNRDRLIELWPTLWLPEKVRALWEDRFSELESGRGGDRCYATWWAEQLKFYGADGL